MITDEMIEMLCYKGEGNDLDYKAERYKFAKGSDNEKSEMLKDILAFANSFRTDTAYILMGFKENPPSPAQVIGLNAEDAIDDSRLQQFVNEKLESKLDFKYEERIYNGKHIAIISIPKQQRPFYLKKDYGKLFKENVYVRRGSSTSIASLREIIMMGQDVSIKEDAKVKLHLQLPDGSPLGNVKEMYLPIFPKKLPDYDDGKNSLGFFSISSPTLHLNRNYWRQIAKYLSYNSRAIALRLVIENQSSFSLTEINLEINCRSNLPYKFLSIENLPQKPDKNELLNMSIISSNIRRHESNLFFDDRGTGTIVRAEIGSVLPDQKKVTNFELVFLPASHGDYELHFSLYANELPKPYQVSHSIEITGESTEVSFEDLRDRFS